MTSEKQGKLNRALVGAIVEGRIREVRAILDAGVKLDAVDGDGWTALHFAARDDHLRIAKLLLSRGASLDAKNGRDWTPLHLAAVNGRESMVKFLLEHGADPAAKESIGRTPADLAGRERHSEIVRLIAEWNSPENVENRRWAAMVKGIRQQQRRLASRRPPAPGL